MSKEERKSMVRNVCMLTGLVVLRFCKCLSFIGFWAGVLLITGCSGEKAQRPKERGCGAHAALAEIDSLMWRQPDSAFILLQQFAVNPKADSLDEFNGHYIQLLISELLYKNYYAQTNRPELRQAVEFFDSLTLTINDHPHASWRHCGLDPQSPELNDNLIFLDARAHYINGVGYYEQDSATEACKEYLNALDAVERIFLRTEPSGYYAQFLALTYNRLGELFSKQFMMESAIDCFKQAYSYCKIATTSPYGESNTLYRIGNQYVELQEYDSAYYYFEMALDLLPDSLNVIYRDLISSRALMDYQLNNQADSPLKELKKVMGSVVDEDEALTRRFTIGNIYYEEAEFDSALLYLELVFEHKSDILMRIQAAELLHAIYDSMDNRSKEEYYMRFLAQNKAMESDNKAEVSRLNDVYKNYMFSRQKQYMEQKANERKEKVFRVLLVIGGFSLFLAMMHLLRHRNRKEVRSREISHNAMMKRLQNTNIRLREENERLIGSQSMVKTEITLQKASASDYEALMKESICYDLLHRFGKTEIITTNKPAYYANLAITSRERQRLAAVVSKHCPDFCPLLLEKYPNLKQADFEFCRFLLIGLTEPQVAVLLQKDYSTIWKRSRKIKETLRTVEPKHCLRHVLFD